MSEFNSILNNIIAKEVEKEMCQPLLFAGPRKPLTRWQKLKNRFNNFKYRAKEAWSVLLDLP